ncbi:lysylphosphatidylglycerol synthase domain-containing protein [Nocardia crassostreae]|uniref:lysylphosphatidylglycerol synthase domain-containing protein n=1 Tax=Nocardia crassostreae TaxID=53428 RepID=UPI0008348B8A|nr:lysylphosphatidylglycerol synthase domain-containing protein [Nocardia crassostreae]
MILAVVVVWQRETMAAGVRSLAGADPRWLVLAVLATAAMWPTSVWMLRGSMPVNPPTGHLFAVQWAVTAASLIPAAPLLLRLRFLRRAGLSHAAALSSIALLGLAVLAVRLPLIVIAVLATPNLMDRAGTRLPWDRLDGTVSSTHTAILENPWRSGAIITTVTLLCLTLTATAAFFAHRYASARGGWRALIRHWFTRHHSRAAADFEWKSIATTAIHPVRATLLWTSAAAQPFLNIAALLAILHAVDVNLPPTDAFVVYLITIVLAPLIPSPNGIATKEIAMVTGLTAIAGVAAGIAVGVALAFRLLTFWSQIPLGLLAVSYLSRRRAI